MQVGGGLALSIEHGPRRLILIGELECIVLLQEFFVHFLLDRSLYELIKVLLSSYFQLVWLVKCR